MASSPTQFKLQKVPTRAGPVALVTIDNGEDWTRPNTFGEAALRSLAGVLDQLRTGDWRGLLLTGKPFVFAVGADIGEFGEITPDRARLGGQAGHELFSRIRELPFVTVAAINGAALGGGVEIALHCDYRTIASSVRHFACPEVFLGLIPGWGGTQLVPQLVGAEAAVKFIVENPLRQNRMLNAQQAFEGGYADACFEPVEFLDESLAFLLDRVEEGADKRRPAADLSDVAEVCRKARSRLDGQVHGATPAPYRALDLIEGAATWPLEVGYRAEEDALADLLPGPEAQASVYAFNLVERRAKRGVGMPDAEPRRVQKVGLVGAGLMARQLALLFLRRLEVPIVLRDLTQEQVDEGIAWIHEELDDLAKRGRLAEGKARFLGSIVTGGTGWDVFAGCDLVLEAVFEEMEVKKEVFAELEQVVSPECVLATNTSSLSVTEMGAELVHPERVVGMHFFNPPALMKLVEVVATSESAPTALDATTEVGVRMGRTPIRAKDSPGFVANRLARPFGLESLRILGDEVADAETIDRVCRIGGGFRMGPFELIDLIGLDVNLSVARSFYAQGGEPERWRPSPIQEALVAEGRLGRKSGRGFYEYGEAPHRAPDPDLGIEAPTLDPSVLGEIDPAAARILPRLVAQIANEAAFALEEEVGSPADMDTAMRLGFNWPRGPLELTELIGPRHAVALLEDLREDHGDAYAPAPRLLDQAAS